uniref:Coiled-coil domain-containing protein 104 n=1 Tax=Rhabditophanes sp. KR3021 TaxID=114890 RepID=A0AC35TL51_9BILA
MAVKGMRVSVLESLRHVTNELINTSRHHLLPNENKVLMIDLVNDNMLELCNGQEFGESVLDMTSLQAMSQFLVLTQSEFLKFLLLDVFENVEKEEDNWVIFGIAYKLVKLIMHVKKVYEYERKGLKEKYEMICASELIIKEKKREFKVWHGESNVVVVKDIVGLFLEQLNQTEDSLIIGNEQLIDISKSLVKLLESKVTKSTQIEDLDDVSSCESDDYECSDREGDNGQHMPKYEVFEGQSTKDEDKVEQSTALYQEMSNDHKIQMTNLMNELKAPLQVQRKYHEEAEISAIAVRKGISIEEVKKARQTQIEEDKKREVKKQDLETMYPSPAEMDAQLNLIKEMRENMFLKQKRRTNETVFGDSSDSDY